MRCGINNPGWILAASVSCPCQIRVVLITSVSRPCCIRVVRGKSSPYSRRIREHDYLSVPGQRLSVLRPYGIRVVRVVSVSHPCRLRMRICTGMCHGHIRIRQGQHGYNTDTTRRWYGFDKDICPCQLFWLSQNNRHGQIWPWRPWQTWHGCDTNINRSTRTWYRHLSVSRLCVNPCMCKRTITGMSWWILHSLLIECSLWDNSWDLHSRIPARSGILLSDMM